MLRVTIQNNTTCMALIMNITMVTSKVIMISGLFDEFDR